MWLKFLSRDQIERIHQATLEILEDVGVLIHDIDFLKFMDEAGAIVDYDRKRAKMSSSLVEESVKKAPRHVTFYARDARNNVRFDEEKIFTHPVGGAANVFDLDSGAVRPGNRND